MKKWIIAFVLLTTLGVSVVAVWRYAIPDRHVSDLYRRYEHVDGIAASYIHNYHINDTITLDVTLLEATTDSAWQALCSDFALSDIVEEMKKVAPSAVFSRQVSRHDYTQVVRGNSPDAEILAISCDTKTFSIFHTHNAAETHAVFWHNYHNIDK